MNQSDLPKFSALWLGSYELYGKPCSDAAVALAFRVLARFSLTDIANALEAHVLDPDAGRFTPKPADLVKFITGDPESRPLAAWTAVHTAIERAGPYRTVVFDDRLTMATISDMGGWVELCRVTDENLPFRRNEFCTRYRGYMLTPPVEHPARLLGLAGEREEPILIGNPERAAEVLSRGTLRPRIEMRSAAQIMSPALPAPAATQ